MASEYLKWKFRNVRPDEKRELTPAERRANWWYYHKWHVVIAVALVLSLAEMGITSWNNLKNAPVYQVACVAAEPLPDDTAAALESALTELAGGKRVGVNQYVTGSGQNGGMAMYGYGSADNIKLMADLEGCESCFFLLDDPETFQANYLILRNLDGSMPEQGDNRPFCLRWTDCPVLTALPGVSGEGLYLARRGFWTKKTCKDLEGCDLLWEALTAGAVTE